MTDRAANIHSARVYLAGLLRKALGYFTTRSLNHRRDLPRSWLGNGAPMRSFSVAIAVRRMPDLIRTSSRRAA